VLVGGPPPEFDGEPTSWSPEHLLLSAANLCLMTTYMALAKKSGLETGRYQSRVEGVLEKTKEGILFTRITIHVDIEASKARLEEVRKTLEAAKKYCIVTNALKPPVEMEASIVPTEEDSSEAGAA
jgi:organic hydroperoxide reductase OsmC/OhrA